MKIVNSLSVDLESFVHREFDLTKRKFKDNGFTIESTNYLLELFDAYKTKTTFFIVGEIYEWYPKLIDKILSRGHEIAYHSHKHILIKDNDLLLSELKLSEKFIKKYKPLGFRSPRLYMKKEYASILSDYGFIYDSSIYGQRIEKIPMSNLIEIPVSLFSFYEIKNTYPQNLNASLLAKGLPIGSGIMISIFQKKIQNFIEGINKNNMPAVLFIHPWQFFNYPSNQSFKTFLNIPKYILYKRRINATIEYLLSKNKFVPIRELRNIL